MNYNEALAYIHSLSKFGSKPGLDRVSRLVSLANNPQNDLKFIHIAGTSGKGSTANYCASILKKAGLKVGLYTSPYITDFRERFIINGEMISKADFCRLCELLIPLVKKLNDDGDIITEFEFNTVLAFLWFKEQKCDIVCLEVGMGGRFDATNIIPTPLVSVITKIGLDHTAILGETISEIAFEKCGIIKNGGICVSYPEQRSDAKKVIEKTCFERNCTLFIPNLSDIKNIKTSLTSSTFEFDGHTIKINMPGVHQIYNAVTAIYAIKNSGLNIGYDIIISALTEVKCPARLEILSEKPLIIIDGAHNADKISALYDFIKFFKGKIVAVCGILKDKDFSIAAKKIAPLCRKIVTVTPDNPRALPSEQLCEVCREFCQDVISKKTIKDGALYAFDSLKDDEILLCWGSLYIAGEVRDIILKKLNK